MYLSCFCTALVPMAESMPILPVPVEDITVCCVMHYARAANGCCRAKHHEASRLMKTWREISVCSLQYAEKQTERPQWKVQTQTWHKRNDQKEEEKALISSLLYNFVLSIIKEQFEIWEIFLFTFLPKARGKDGDHFHICALSEASARRLENSQ